MNKKLLYILLALVMVCSVALTACNLTPEKVTITYKYNYEGAPADKTVTLDKGANITLDTPTRTDYKFDGWFTDAACTKAFTDKVANANVTLYAKWTASHTHDLHYQSSSSKHWQECSCGYTTEQVDHTFDANNTCVCGYKQGGTAHTHSWATDWSKDATNHWHVCTGCSELNDKAAHDTNGTDGACSVCGYKAQAQGQAVTVYFYTADWTTVNAYAWTDTPSFAEHLGGWPGTAINAVAGEEGWYSVEVPADTQKIIFNDGSKQTNDLLVADGPYFVGNTGYATKEEAEASLSAPDTWTVAGTAGLCGTEWNTTNADNDMTYDSEKEAWVKTYTGIAAGEHKFKVVKNHMWDEAYPAEDYVLNVASDDATVTIVLKGQEVTVEIIEKEHEHTWSTEWSSDATDHWYACTGCDEVSEKAAHVPGAEATETEPQICTVCKKILTPALGHEHVTEGEYVYDENGHWVVCTCEQKVLEGAHDFTNGDCVCGAKAPVVLSDYRLVGLNEDWTVGIDLVINPENENEYMLTGVEIKATDKFKVYVAAESFTGADPYVGMLKKGVTVAQNVDTANTNSDIKVLEDGKYDIYFDITTNVIWIAKAEVPHEHVWSTEWSSDVTDHWYACTGCDEVSEKAAHVPGAEATETEPQICTVCKKILTPALGHEHVTEGEYVYDENGHWVVCTCEQKVLEGAHDFTNGDCVCGAKAPVVLSDYRLVGLNEDWTVGIDLVINPENENEYMLTGVEIKATDKFKVYVAAESFTGADPYVGMLKKGVTVAQNVDTANTNSDIKVLEDGKYDIYFDITTNVIWIAKAEVVCTEHVESEGYSKDATGHWKTCATCSAVLEDTKAEHDAEGIDGACLACGAVKTTVEDGVVLKGLEEDIVLEVNSATNKEDGRLVEYMLRDLVIEEETLVVFVVNGQYGNNANAGYDSIENKETVSEGEHGKILLAAGTYSFYFKVYNTETSGTYKYEVWVAYTHNHTYTKQSFNATEHWMQCSIEGCTAKDDTTIEAHDNAEDCTICDFVASEVVDNNVLYLTPNANWKVDNARFAAYFFGTNGDTWVSMTDSNSDGIYEVTIPEGDWTNVIFCRMNPSATDNNWTNKWNQTADLNFPMGNEVHYTVKEGTWDNGGGTWSVLPVAAE